jgi:hypothetical protein
LTKLEIARKRIKELETELRLEKLESWRWRTAASRLGLQLELRQSWAQEKADVKDRKDTREVVGRAAQDSVQPVPRAIQAAQ